MARLCVVIVCFAMYFFCKEQSFADCPVIRDEYAIKGKVINCTTEEEFLKHKQVELSKVANYNTEVDWERMLKYATFRKGLVLTIEVTHRRGFVFACEKFLAKEISEPISWKESWIKEDKRSKPNHLFLSESCPTIGKESVFFLDPPCCDTIPAASIDCEVIPVKLLDDIASMCKKSYSAFIHSMPANKSLQPTPPAPFHSPALQSVKNAFLKKKT